MLALLMTPFVQGWLVASGAALVAATAWLRARGDAAPLPDLAPALARRLVISVVVGIVALYLPGLAGEFNIYDDERYILENDVVTQLTGEHLRLVLLENFTANNQELMFLSFQLNWALFKDWYPAWYASNLVVFVGVLGLVARFARHLLGHRGAAALAVALFGTAPIHAELLAWMSARCHLYGLFFALGCLVAYQEARLRTGRARWGLLAVSLVAFAGSQISKPIFVFVPAWLVLLDWLERRRDLGRAALEKLPFLAVGVGFVVKMVHASDAVGRVRPAPLGGSWLNTALQDLNQLVEYGRAALLPTVTGPAAPYNEVIDALHVRGPVDVATLGYAPLASGLILALAGLAAVGLWVRRRDALPLFCYAAFLTSFVAVLNIPPHTTPMAYRYTLSAHVVGAVLLAAAVVRGWGLPRAVRLGGAAALLLASVLAANANRDAWSSSVALWTREARLRPLDAVSAYYAGKALIRADRPAKAIPHLERAVALDDTRALARRRLADACYEAGQHERALEHYRVYFAQEPSKMTPFYRRRMTELEAERVGRQN